MYRNLMNDFEMEPIIANHDSSSTISWFIDRTGDPTLLESSPYARYFRNNAAAASATTFADNVAMNERINNQNINNQDYFNAANNTASEEIENNPNSLNFGFDAAAAAAYPIVNNRINILENYIAPVENNSNISFTEFNIDSSIVNTFVPVVAVYEDMEVSEEDRECCICMDQKEKSEICSLNCSHTYCSNCISRTLYLQFSRGQILTCSLCRTNVTSVQVKNIESRNKFLMR